MREFTVVYQTVEDGWIMASVPELPGVVTQGRDMAEARSMIREAFEMLLASTHAASSEFSLVEVTSQGQAEP